MCAEERGVFLISTHYHVLLGELTASEMKKLQRKERKAQLKAQAKAQEEKKGGCGYCVSMTIGHLLLMVMEHLALCIHCDGTPNTLYLW